MNYHFCVFSFASLLAAANLLLISQNLALFVSMLPQKSTNQKKNPHLHHIEHVCEHHLEFNCHPLFAASGLKL